MDGAAPAVLQGAGQFRAVIDNEIVVFDASQCSTTTWTAVTRGAEGSTAATHSSGVAVYHFLTKGALDARYARVGTDNTVGGSGGSALSSSVVNDLATIVALPAPTGVAATDTANLAAAVTTAKATGAKVVAPPAPFPGYVINAVQVVPSGVWVDGAGEGATIFTPATGFAGPVFELQKGTGSPLNSYYEFSAQGWLNGLRKLSVWGNVIPSPSAIGAGAITDNRQVADGIWIHDGDHSKLEDVTVNWLAGYGVKVGGVVREGHFVNVKMLRCGNSSTSKAPLWLTNSASPADQNNTLHFENLRIVYPHWIAVYGDQTGDNAALGTRLLHFVGGQIEGGGYGGTAGTMRTSSTPFPYDLIYLGNCKTVYFGEMALATTTQKLINCVGNSTPGNMQSLILSKCELIDAGNGPGIYADRIDSLIIDDCFGYTVGGKIVTVTTHTGRVIYADTNDVLDVNTGLRVTRATNFDIAAKPAAFSGPTDLPIVVGSGGTAPAFGANWGAIASAPWQDPMFWKDSTGTVHIEGYVKVTAAGGTTQGDVIFTLPVGYRPANRVLVNNNAVYIESDGTVRNNSGTQGQNYSFYFNGAVFRAGG